MAESLLLKCNAAQPWEWLPAEFVARLHQLRTSGQAIVCNNNWPWPTSNELIDCWYEEAVNDPLVLRVCPSAGTIRLVAPHHLIEALAKHDRPVPTTVEIANEVIGAPSNGPHLYQLKDFETQPHLDQLPPGQYWPSDVFVLPTEE